MGDDASPLSRFFELLPDVVGKFEAAFLAPSPPQPTAQDVDLSETNGVCDAEAGGGLTLPIPKRLRAVAIAG